MNARQALSKYEMRNGTDGSYQVFRWNQEWQAIAEPASMVPTYALLMSLAIADMNGVAAMTNEETIAAFKDMMREVAADAVPLRDL